MTPYPTTPCIQWPGKIALDGYARVNRRGKGYSPQLAHRWTYEQVHGPVPAGMVVMHLCDHRACVNIEHLRIGTQSENLKMAYERGMPRRGMYSRPGTSNPASKLTEEQVREIRSSSDTLRVIAQRFGISITSAGNVRRGQTYATVS